MSLCVDHKTKNSWEVYIGICQLCDFCWWIYRKLFQGLCILQRWSLRFIVILFLEKNVFCEIVGCFSFFFCPLFPQPLLICVPFKTVCMIFFILCLPEQFNWDDYLKETESVAAPLHCFRQVCQILCKRMCVCFRVTGWRWSNFYVRTACKLSVWLLLISVYQ